MGGWPSHVMYNKEQKTGQRGARAGCSSAACRRPATKTFAAAEPCCCLGQPRWERSVLTPGQSPRS